MVDHTDLVRRIHATPARGVLAVTGGGGGLLAELLEVAGASNTVLEARVPYAAAALADWLRAVPDQACSAETACALAMAAYQRAVALTDGAPGLFGFAVTASLATTRTKRGAHRAHLAMQTADASYHWHLRLERGARDRAGEEALLRALALRCLGTGLALDGLPDLELTAAEHVDEAHVEAPLRWQRLLAGEERAIRVDAGRDAPRVVFPGAFNPLHGGHLGMAAYAHRRLEAPPHFEISLANVDKPPLDFLALEHRTAQFDAATPLWLSTCPTFLDKARVFAGACFMVGIDTVLRIADARYYGGDPTHRDQAIDEIRRLGCRFLVFGRRTNDRFTTLADHELPAILAALCNGVPEEAFRDDASSTALRTRANLPRA